MRWPLNQLSLLVSSLALLGVSMPAISVDESRLWLAKSDQVLYLPLVRAALAAANLERCVEVLEGTLDRTQSTSERPMFRILCRQADGKSYNEMVDGLSFETLTTPKVVEVVLTEEQIEQRKREEQERQRQEDERRKMSLWQMCMQALQDRTKMMIDLTWDSQSQPEPITFDASSAVFKVQFQAKSIWGEALRYEATCTVDNERVKSVEIKRG